MLNLNTTHPSFAQKIEASHGDVSEASQGEHHRRWWPHCNWSDPPSARRSLPTEPTITELRHPTALWLMWVNLIGSTIPGGRNHRSICLGQLALLYSHDFGMVLGKSILHGELDVKNLRCQKIWTSFVNSNVAMATPLQMPTVKKLKGSPGMSKAPGMTSPWRNWRPLHRCSKEPVVRTVHACSDLGFDPLEFSQRYPCSGSNLHTCLKIIFFPELGFKSTYVFFACWWITIFLWVTLW